jgi:hypothetical protein
MQVSVVRFRPWAPSIVSITDFISFFPAFGKLPESVCHFLSCFVLELAQSLIVQAPADRLLQCNETPLSACDGQLWPQSLLL